MRTWWSRLRRSRTEKVFHQNTVRVGSLVLSAGLLGAIAFMDPGARLEGRFWAALIMLGFNLCFFYLLWLPAVCVGPRELRIIGVLRCWRIPWEAVRAFGTDPAAPSLFYDGGDRFPSVELSDGRWVNIGILPSDKMDKTGHWDNFYDEARQAWRGRAPGSEDSPPEVVTRLYLCWPQLLVLIVLYGIAYGIAVLRWPG